jgi:ribonucleoside-diphosphate reductase beta chain
MARNAQGTNGTTAAALRRMEQADPELAARLIVHSLPAAAAELPDGLSYRIEIDDLGAWRVSANGDAAEVTPIDPGAELDGDAFALATDARSLAEVASGRSALRALVGRRLRIRGKRRKALALRRLSTDAGPRDLARIGAPIDPDLLYRSLPYAIESEWTKGHNFRIAYELLGDNGGRWHLDVRDGVLSGGRGFGDGEPDSLVRLEVSTWLALLRDDISPSEAMRQGLTEVEGDVHAITVMGRWIDRADGRDAPELEREADQRAVQERRVGTWGGSVNGTGAGDPGETGRRKPGELLSYGELYALWERQNWRVQDLDFSRDREHWLATPTEGQRHTAFSMGSFYVGEERVTADLAPFLLAAPSGEVEAFLATQLVDEARHAVFFDRWAAEVMAISADDLRGRLKQMEGKLLDAWHFTFDESLRGVANRIKANPDDLELFVEGIVTYHLVIEGVLAMPGQRVIIDYTSSHNLYPGFNEGFRLVERDEHRHIAFGVRFLRDVCAERPEMRKVVLDTLTDLLPGAAMVFTPPEEDPGCTDFHSYDYHSSQVYGFAYKALQRRCSMIGVEIPGPEELMPGPVDLSGLSEKRSLVPTS